MMHITHLLHVYTIVQINFGLFLTRPWRVEADGAGTCVCALNTGRGIGTETSEADNVFPSDDLFGY